MGIDSLCKLPWFAQLQKLLFHNYFDPVIPGCTSSGLALVAAVAEDGEGGGRGLCVTWSISSSLPHVCVILGSELPLANHKPS